MPNGRGLALCPQPVNHDARRPARRRAVADRQRNAVVDGHGAGQHRTAIAIERGQAPDIGRIPRQIDVLASEHATVENRVVVASRSPTAWVASRGLVGNQAFLVCIAVASGPVRLIQDQDVPLEQRPVGRVDPCVQRKLDILLEHAIDRTEVTAVELRRAARVHPILDGRERHPEKLLIGHVVNQNAVLGRTLGVNPAVGELHQRGGVGRHDLNAAHAFIEEVRQLDPARRSGEPRLRRHAADRGLDQDPGNALTAQVEKLDV